MIELFPRDREKDAAPVIQQSQAVFQFAFQPLRMPCRQGKHNIIKLAGLRFVGDGRTRFARLFIVRIRADGALPHVGGGILRPVDVLGQIEHRSGGGVRFDVLRRDVDDVLRAAGRKPQLQVVEVVGRFGLILEADGDVAPTCGRDEEDERKGFV